MEEYLQYLNTVSIIKSHQQDEQDKFAHFKKKTQTSSRFPKEREHEPRERNREREHRDRSRDRERDRDNFLKNKRYNRDFKDLDNPENKPSSGSRQLISYDDL